MGMRAFMADCITDVALQADEAGDSATLTPAEATQGLPIVVVMGTPRPVFGIDVSGANQGRRASAVASRTAARGVIRQLTGIDREPDRQDLVTIGSGVWEGIWVIENVVADIDDTCTLDLVWDRPYAVSAEGVRKS